LGGVYLFLKEGSAASPKRRGSSTLVVGRSDREKGANFFARRGCHREKKRKPGVSLTIRQKPPVKKAPMDPKGQGLF